MYVFVTSHTAGIFRCKSSGWDSCFAYHGVLDGVHASHCTWGTNQVKRREYPPGIDAEVPTGTHYSACITQQVQHWTSKATGIVTSGCNVNIHFACYTVIQYCCTYAPLTLAWLRKSRRELLNADRES